MFIRENGYRTKLCKAYGKFQIVVSSMFPHWKIRILYLSECRYMANMYGQPRKLNLTISFFNFFFSETSKLRHTFPCSWDQYPRIWSLVDIYQMTQSSHSKSNCWPDHSHPKHLTTPILKLSGPPCPVPKLVT